MFIIFSSLICGRPKAIRLNINDKKVSELREGRVRIMIMISKEIIMIIIIIFIEIIMIKFLSSTQRGSGEKPSHSLHTL